MLFKSFVKSINSRRATDMKSNHIAEAGNAEALNHHGEHRSIPACSSKAVSDLLVVWSGWCLHVRLKMTTTVRLFSLHSSSPCGQNCQDHILFQADSPLLYKNVLAIHDMLFSAPTGTLSGIAQSMEASSVQVIVSCCQNCCFPIDPIFLQQIAQQHCCLIIVASPSIQFFSQHSIAAIEVQVCFEDRTPSACNPVSTTLNQLKGGKW